MDERELRIGNWIDNNGNFEQVKYDVHFRDIHYIKDHGYTAIPLTEEWLIKFGFKMNTLNTISNGKLMLRIDESKCYMLSVNNIEIEYVHKLQNLYFELTGEELKIK